MTLYIKVGSITNAQRSQRTLRQKGYKSIIKKLENPSPQDGCGYMVVVNTYTEEPISIFILLTFLKCIRISFSMQREA